MYTVYQHKNKINGKVYIGITKQKPEQRWRHGQGCKSSPHFYAAIQKYGWDNFEHNILFQNLTKEEACKKEQELIAKYHSMDREFGYNSTSGGDMFTMNKETKQKISQSMMGNKNGLGHPCSEEKKKKISEAQKGKHLTEKNINRNFLKQQKIDMPLVLTRPKKIYEKPPIKNLSTVKN